MAYVSSLIASIASCVSISKCRSLHCKVVKTVSYRQGFIGDQLVRCYLRLGDEVCAEKLFGEMPERDIVSWNSLISGYAERGYLGKCLKALSKMMMRSEVGLGFRPNEVTFLSIISACVHHVKSSREEEGRCVHGLVVKYGVLEEVKVVNALINWYGKVGDLSSSCKLFEDLSVKNVVSWNTMIVVYLQNGLAEDGLGCFNVSRRVGNKADQAAFLAVLRVCEALGAVKVAQGIHGMILCCGFNANMCVTTALLDSYAKLGRLEDSSKVFSEITSPDSMAWTAMLAAYATHGYGRSAIKVFEVMVDHSGISPDHVTLTHLLSACSHSGLVEEGKHYFETMLETYGVEPRLEHYSCMVDLMGRFGFLQDAYRMIKEMPMEPSSGVWGALLGACRIYGDAKLGKEAAERLFELEPCDGRNYIMLANIYSASGEWEDASRIRNLMKQKGLARASGCSEIEHGNKIHKFVVGDWSHPESEKIQKKLREIRKKMKELGYKSRTEFVLHDVDEDVKEEMINQHSEKIAMAFGLLVISPTEPIIIRKNLRICGDCHETAKAISLLEKRRLIIRDSKRFHHFSEGSCSCRDYW
ncbi:DYW domain-containing protein [Hirschfeldia incana]|nr:DYW domain-containing protein [Hirschfeldia incana]